MTTKAKKPPAVDPTPPKPASALDELEAMAQRNADALAAAAAAEKAAKTAFDEAAKRARDLANDKATLERKIQEIKNEALGLATEALFNALLQFPMRPDEARTVEMASSAAASTVGPVTVDTEDNSHHGGDQDYIVVRIAVPRWCM